MCVVLCHADIPRFINGGPVGVDVFFVISGFVITGVLLRERESSGRTNMLAFYGRRARRIIPVAVLVIAVVLIVDRIVDGATLAGYVAVQGRWVAMFQANTIFFPSLLHDFYTGPNPPQSVMGLAAYWSLAVEEQFYLIFPALIAIIAVCKRHWSLRIKLAAMLTLIAVASYAWSVTSTQSEIINYISTFTRAWELAVGALLALAEVVLRRIPGPVACVMTWVGLGGILFVALTFTLANWPGARAAWPVAATGLVIAGGTSAPRFGAQILLRLSPFKWLGLWSFSLYLWHKPIDIWAYQIQPDPSWLVRIVMIAIAITLSALSYFLVENPIRQSSYLKRSATTSLALGLALVASCIILTLAI